MQKAKLLILLLLILYTLNEAKAQGTRLFTSADGLPSSQFIYMNHDKDGYIWICNYGGLARFDGLGLTTFLESRGSNNLRSNNVYRFITDRLGQHWVGTARGLQLFHPATEQFEHIRLDKEEDDNVSCKGKSLTVCDLVILPDKKSLLVCTGIDGFYVVDIQTHKINTRETLKFRGALRNSVVRRMFIDSKSRLWIVSAQLILLDLKTFRHLKLEYRKSNGILPNNMEVTDFLEDKNTHTLLVADNWNGVLAFDERNNQLYKLSTLKYQSPQCLLQREDGTLLVGREKGGIGKIDLEKHSISEYKVRDCPLDLTCSKIHTMVEDRWGNLYIGIYQKGMLVVPASSGGFRYQGITDDSFVQNRAAITSFAQTNDGQMLVGTDGGGIFQGKSFDSMKQLPLPAQCNGSVQHMVSGNDGKVWVATYGSGLFCYNHGSVKAIPDNKEIVNKNSSYLQLDNQRNKLYIGNIGTGLNRLDLISGKLSKLTYGTPWVFALKLDSKGRLWIGASNCVCFDLSNNRLFNFRLEAIENNTVHTFLEHNGLMYIGTSNGLFIYDEQSDSCRHYPLDNANKIVSVMALTSSSDQSVWMSTNRGLIRFNPQNGDIRLFSSYDIRKVGDFHSNASFRQNDGTLVFGGDNGIISFDPVAIVKEKNEWDPIHFCSLNINGKVVSYDVNADHNLLDAAIGYASHITLPYNQNSFSIRFSAFNYAVSSQLRYLYQLKGYENVWHTTTADNPQAVYNQLPPGKYALHVKSFNENKQVQTAEASIFITVNAPWYWCWWAKLLYFIVLLAFLYSQYRTYQTRQKSKKRLRTVMGEFLRIKENYQTLIHDQAPEKVSQADFMDEKLKKKIMAVISQHTSDAGFGVEELSREIALSRVHLYRRTKELFGCSTNDLLKSVRMKKAGLMLIQSKISVSDVAYQVGFSEPSYFSKAFRNYFNMSPKDFVARYRDNADEKTLKRLFEI